MTDSYRRDLLPNKEGSYIISSTLPGAQGKYYPYNRHMEGLQVLWVDGHVAYVKIRNFENPWNELTVGYWDAD